MKEVYVVYWSSTGNTQAMAEAVGAGINEAGGTARVVEVSSVQAPELENQACFALGASAMGAEELDGEMDAFVSEVEAFAAGRQIALFGSYDWGDGEWMRSWADRMSRAGAVIVDGEGLIANLAPDEETVAACKALGAKLVQ